MDSLWIDCVLPSSTNLYISHVYGSTATTSPVSSSISTNSVPLPCSTTARVPRMSPGRGATSSNTYSGSSVVGRCATTAGPCPRAVPNPIRTTLPMVPLTHRFLESLFSIMTCAPTRTSSCASVGSSRTSKLPVATPRNRRVVPGNRCKK